MAVSALASPVVLCCKGVLFDMDGILISSLGSVERSWTKWAQLRGIDPAYAVSVVHGRRAIDSVQRLRPDLDSAAELKVIEDLECADNDGLQVLPGVQQLLAALPMDRWTVVTSATERLARVRLRTGGVPAPDQLVTAETVQEGKPSPAPFLAGAALLGFAPEDCIVFEDSASGVEAGRAAGCTVVATTFSHAAQSLRSAHYLIADLSGVAARSTADGLELRFLPLAR